MRIGFDLRPVIKKNSRDRGIGKYSYQLIKSLLRVNARHDYVLYTIGGQCPELGGSYESRHLFYLPRPSRLNWVPDPFFLPRQIRRDALEIFHATEITSIPRLHRSAPGPRSRVWVHIHDLTPLVFWEQTVERVPKDFAYGLKKAFARIKEANLVITDSLHSKKDILGVTTVRLKVE